MKTGQYTYVEFRVVRRYTRAYEKVVFMLLEDECNFQQTQHENVSLPGEEKVDLLGNLIYRSESLQVELHTSERNFKQPGLCCEGCMCSLSPRKLWKYLFIGSFSGSRAGFIAPGCTGSPACSLFYLQQHFFRRLPCIFLTSRKCIFIGRLAFGCKLLACSRLHSPLFIKSLETGGENSKAALESLCYGGYHGLPR